MFTIRCLKIASAYPVKQQIRHKSIFHRGFKFIFRDDNLIWTNCFTSGLCMVLGDLIQQELDYEAKILEKRYDWLRAARMFIVGAAMGPMHHYYYLHLDKLLPKADMKTVMKKVLCDQLFASPATILCFYYGLGFLEGSTISESTDEVKRKFPYVYAGDCLYWPPVQIINFYYLSPSYRVVYINMATMLFNVFMSYMKHDFEKH